MANSRTPDQLQKLLEQGDAAATADFFKRLDENKRRSFAKLAEAWMRDLAKNPMVGSSPGTFGLNKTISAAGLAVLATCSLSVCKSFRWLLPPHGAGFLQVLADRRPKWLDEYTEYLLEREHPAWLTVRAMMKAGLCKKPKHDNYVLGMVCHHRGVGGAGSDPTERRGNTSSTWNVARHLLAEPDLLQVVWRLFEIEGYGELSLAAHDKYAHGDQRWDQSLVELSKQGHLSRDRLVDASLDALDRGFAQFSAGWFSSFHELLTPTLVERLKHRERYLRLLASPIPPTVSFALAAVTIIDKQVCLPGKLLLESLRPLMRARHKGTTLTALKMVGKVVTREAARAEQAVLIAAEALGHESSDVQAAALKFIEAFGSRTDSALTRLVTEAIPLVVPSLRGRIFAWINLPGSVEAATDSKHRDQSIPSGQFEDLQARAVKVPSEWAALVGLDEAFGALRDGRLAITACDFDGTEFPRLDATRAIDPIATLDELIVATAISFENPDQYDAIERIFDGISRLCDQRTGDFERRTGPLCKRALQFIRRPIIPFTGHNPAGDLLGVVLAWLIGDFGRSSVKVIRGNEFVEFAFRDEKAVTELSGTRTIGAAMALRSRQLAERVQKRIAVGTLSAPTHAGGWIDPLALLDRIGDERVVPAASDFEKVLALLRLAPENRDAALSRLPDSNDEFLNALRHALGGKPKNIGATSWLWAAAARSRAPWSDDLAVIARHPDLGPDGGSAATARFAAKVERQMTKCGQSYKHAEFAIDVAPCVPEVVDLRLLSVLQWRDSNLSARNGRPRFGSSGEVRQRFSICPISLESAFARGVAAIANNLDWWEAQWHNRLCLEPLLDPDVPLRPMAILLIVLGLAAKEPGEHGLATDVAIAAIDDGRLDGAKLGSLLLELLPAGLIMPARLAKRMGDVAGASALHAEVVRAAIAGSLRGNADDYPKDLHAVVGLLLELVSETNGFVDASSSSSSRRSRERANWQKPQRASLTVRSEPPRPTADRFSVSSWNNDLCASSVGARIQFDNKATLGASVASHRRIKHCRRDSAKQLLIERRSEPISLCELLTAYHATKNSLVAPAAIPAYVRFLESQVTRLAAVLTSPARSSPTTRGCREPRRPIR